MRFREYLSGKHVTDFADPDRGESSLDNRI
jgi:hypothetical protein